MRSTSLLRSRQPALVLRSDDEVGTRWEPSADVVSAFKDTNGSSNYGASVAFRSSQ